MSNTIFSKYAWDLQDNLSFSLVTRNPLGAEAVTATITDHRIEIGIADTEDDIIELNTTGTIGWVNTGGYTEIRGKLFLSPPLHGYMSTWRSEVIGDPTIPFKATVPPVPIYGGGVVGNAEVPLDYHRSILLPSGNVTWFVVLTDFQRPLPSDV